MASHYTWQQGASPSSLFSNNPLDISGFTIPSTACLFGLVVITEGNTARTGGVPIWDVGGVDESFTDSGNGFINGDECGVELFYLANPTPGTSKTLRIPNSGSLNIAYFYFYLEPDTGYAAPTLVDYGETAGYTANPSITSGSLPTESIIIAALASGYRNTPTAGGSGLYTLRGVYDEGQFVWGYESTLDAGAAGTKTVDFTQDADDWGLMYFAFQPESEGGIVPLAMNQYRQRRN